MAEYTSGRAAKELRRAADRRDTTAELQANELRHLHLQSLTPHLRKAVDAALDRLVYTEAREAAKKQQVRTVAANVRERFAGLDDARAS